MVEKIDRREFLKNITIGAFLVGSGRLVADLSDSDEFIMSDGIMMKKKIFNKANEITVPNYTLNLKDKNKCSDYSLEPAGNGFIIGDKYLTASHVLDGASAIGTGDILINGVKLSILERDKVKDVAIFSLPKSLESHVNDYKLNLDSKIYKGQEILVYGNPMNYFFKYSRGFFRKGKISNANYPSILSLLNGLVVFDSPIWPGDSGSPVFDFNSGDVLGLVVRKTKKEAYFTSIEPFRKIINKRK